MGKSSFNIPSQYTLVQETPVNELKSQAYILKHKKSGARLFLMPNEDDNKVFCIGFRTPPENSTGVAHITEHSVLCGSEKFPLKDPFVELVKGSLNTFLNAMTYPDKTVYPVASCNDTDFQNLMDVYMDAVLHPNVYKTDKIFRQEGWHYEMEDKDSPLTINGVVYNEMKGALSTADAILDRYVMSEMLPDTTYGNESGGDPDVIPELTYEEFLNFHRRYYHPCNSYIYLYGDMDYEEKLNWLDREYLSEYDAIELDSTIKWQKPFTVPKKINLEYPASEDGDDGAYLAFACSFGNVLDPKEYVAMDILEYALLSVPGAPLKQALLDKGFGKDVDGGANTSIMQPYFEVIVKDGDPLRMQEFLDTIQDVLKEQVKNGLNKRTLASYLNTSEFKAREADFGPWPRGLMYGLQCFDSWLYDETNPVMHLKYEETFNWLREHMEDGYFEGLIRKYLINNPHQVQVIMKPVPGLDARKEKALADRLAEQKACMNAAEIEKIVKETAELKLFQETEDTPETLAMLPMLSRDDIKKDIAPRINELRKTEGGDILFHNMFTGGIDYLRILFDLDGLSVEELQYVSLLTRLLGDMNTEHFTYRDLSDEIGIHSGGISVSGTSYVLEEDTDRPLDTITLNARTKTGELGFAFDMFREIVFTTDLTDKKRLHEILSQAVTRRKTGMASNGNRTAIDRASVYYSKSSRLDDVKSGLTYVRFLDNLDRSFNKKADEIIEKLEAVRKKIFLPSRMFVSFTGDEEGFQELPALLAKFNTDFAAKYEDKNAVGTLFKKEEKGYPELDDIEKLYGPAKKIGLGISSQVNYVARCGNFRKAGLDYTGALKVLTVILNYDYLWINLRVKGGAYGCMSGFASNGDSYLVSYRDPNMKETNEIYGGISDYLRDFDVDERDMTKYVIGTISGMDTPMNPYAKGNAGLVSYLSGISDEARRKTRDQVINCTVEDIRALAAHIDAILADGCLTVVGSESKIAAQKEIFEETESLFPDEE